MIAHDDRGRRGAQQLLRDRRGRGAGRLVTTHFPAIHQSFLETCWPPATRKSVLLQQADVLVFATGAVSDRNRAAVATAFAACNSTRVVAVPNPGKQKGAMLPLQMAEREGWWSGSV